METSELTDRLVAAAGNRTYRAIADLTGTNAETVRRYMQGQAPSVEFLAALCLTLGINEQWLITGRGPMRSNDVKSHALKEASPSELLSAMAGTIERIADRVDRLELFVTSMETRLRGRAVGSRGDSGPGGAPVSVISRGTSAVPAETDTHTEQTDGFTSPRDIQAGSAGKPGLSAAAAEGTRNARSIADAIAQRPRPDAR